MAETEAKKFPVTYVGPFPDGVEEGEHVVKPGESIEVDEERAAHLTEGDAWELTNPKGKKPTAAPPGEEATSLSPSDFDVHENPPEEAASTGEPATEET